MEIPFTINEFLEVFKRYNEGIFPAQIVAYLLGLFSVSLLFKRNNVSSVIISGVLSLFWIWMGIVYHLIYFSRINEAAKIFGIAFILQGLLFLIFGVFKRRINFRLDLPRIDLSQLFTIILIVYGMFIYPILNQLLGHPYPYSPVFGLAPCPTVIFTFGILMLSVPKVPFYLIIIPFLWSLVGFFAAINLGMVEDYGLVIAGVLGLIFILIKPEKSQSPGRNIVH